MNMCDFGQNTNESLTLRKEFISDQKNEYITCRTLLHRVYIEKKITGVNYLILISSLTILLDILMIFTCTENSISIFFRSWPYGFLPLTFVRNSDC